MGAWAEYKFLKFLDDNTTPLIEQINIENFMIKNFRKPDPLSAKTTNDNDKGVNLLKKLKTKGLIEYDDTALSHVNTWFVDAGDNPKIKRWFDTLHQPMYVSLTDLYYSNYKNLSLFSLVLNKKSVLKHIKYAIKNVCIYGVKLLINIWKFIVLVAATFLGGWLSIDHNFMDSVNWLKMKFHF